MYTEEQSKYIDFLDKIDTKLIACAGSGKTRCIIARMNNLIEKNIYTSNEILMLTFSRFTRDDFMNKINTYDAKLIDKTCVKTIDSYAKSLIDINNEIDVSLLSFRFMKYLESTTIEDLMKNDRLKSIKSIFVDESQDLNNIQYNILCLCKQKLGIVINLIGDPNQNIYQFRKSSDKYLTDFPAKTFYLTKNFRSYGNIVHFSKYLRPVQNTDVYCNKTTIDCKPIMMFHNKESEFEKCIVDLLRKSIYTRKIEASDFAILSPTRGKMRGWDRSHGLCFITNILSKAKIPFKQFYEEATDEINNNIQYKPEKGHVNVLTYMGSKGLEWKYVIIIDANMCLINKRHFNNEKHLHDRYLLYVACSRAIVNMFIFSKYYPTQHVTRFDTNPWFSEIPKQYYLRDSRFDAYFKFPELKYVTNTIKERRITKLIDNMTEEMLDKLSSLINYEKMTKTVIKIFKKDYSHIENNCGIFFGKFAERLFYCYHNIKEGLPHRKYADIENIISNQHILINVPADVYEWFYNVRLVMTWEKYEKEKEMLIKEKNNIVEYVDKKFDRNFPFADHTMLNDGYYSWFILKKRKWIKKYYDKYINCTNVMKIRKFLFNISILLYTLETQHYFHVRNKGLRFQSIRKCYKQMFNEMTTYIDNNGFNIINSMIPVSKWGFVGEIDFIDHNNEIWEIKTVRELTLKHVLQILMYNLMMDKNTKNLNFINLLKGEIVIMNYELTENNIIEIKNIFEASSLD